jgi:hypothetical protein
MRLSPREGGVLLQREAQPEAGAGNRGALLFARKSVVARHTGGVEEGHRVALH